MKQIVALAVAAALLLAACSSESAEDGADEIGEAGDPTETAFPSSIPEEEPESVPDPDADDPAKGGEIIYGLSDNGTGFDTTQPIIPGALRIVAALNDPLVAMDDTGMWQPNLAESLTQTEDATVWTILLRPDVTFHDGEPVDAAAVKANLDSFRASPTVGFGLADVENVEVIDPLTVEVSMRRPWAAFPNHLVGQAGYMVSPSTIGTNDDFVGVGPFVLESWVPGDSARVVANPDYWRGDEGFPYLDAITFKVIPDDTTRRQGLEAGDIEAYETPAAQDIEDFLASDDIDVHISTSEANEFLLVLNTATAPTDDVRVRRALAAAIDRQLLIDSFRAGLTEPAGSQISPSNRFWVDNDYPGFDLAAAAELIEEYEADNGPATLTLTTLKESPTLDMVEVIASFWQDAGVDVTVETIGQTSVANRAIADDFQALVWSQFGSPDPDGDYVFFHSSGGLLNWSNLVDPEIDAALDQGRESADESTRMDAYAGFQRRLAEEIPMLWIDHLAGVEAIAAIPSVRGITSGTLPDGSAADPLTFGSYHSYGQIWLASG